MRFPRLLCRMPQPASPSEGFDHRPQRRDENGAAWRFHSRPAVRSIIDEARIIGRLQHPNIPPVYEVGLDDKGRPFTRCASKGHEPSPDLDEMKAGKTRTIINFTVRRTLSIFQKVCDAIAFAHSKEVLHRNLKPETLSLRLWRGLCNRLGRDTEQRAFCGRPQLAKTRIRHRSPRKDSLRDHHTYVAAGSEPAGGESNIDSRGLLRVERRGEGLRNPARGGQTRDGPAVAQQLSFGSRIPAGSGHLQGQF